MHHLLNGFDRRLRVFAVEGQRRMTCPRDDTMDPNGCMGRQFSVEPGPDLARATRGLVGAEDDQLKTAWALSPTVLNTTPCR